MDNDTILFQYNPDLSDNFIPMTDIPVDKTGCVFFGGYKTIRPDVVMREYKRLYQFKQNTNLDFSIYGFVYPVPNIFCKNLVDEQKLSVNQAKKLLFSQMINRKLMHRYINQLFRMLVVPRLQDKLENKLPVDIAKRYMRNMTFVVHSYSVITAFNLNEMTYRYMHKLGYSDAECAEIQNQMVFIVLSPSFLLRENKSRVLNFASAADTTVLYGNQFPQTGDIQFIQDYNLLLTPCMFNNHKEIKKRSTLDIEHMTWPLLYQSNMTDTGKNTVYLLNNALYTALQSNLVSDTKSLFCKSLDDEKLFSTKVIGNNTKYTNARIMMQSGLKRLVKIK